MKIDNVAFNLTEKDLAEFKLTLIDNDANGLLTIGDDIQTTHEAVLPVSERHLTTWDGMIALLESGGANVVKTSNPNSNLTYLCFGETKLEGVIELGISSTSININPIDVRSLARKWPALAHMITGDYEQAYQYQKFEEAKKNVSSSDANDHIADTIIAARLMRSYDVAEKNRQEISMGFLDGAVEAVNIYKLIQAQKSIEEGVTTYINNNDP